MGSGGMRSGRSRKFRIVGIGKGKTVHDELITRRALDEIQRASVGTLIRFGGKEDGQTYRVTGTRRDKKLELVSYTYQTPRYGDTFRWYPVRRSHIYDVIGNDTVRKKVKDDSPISLRVREDLQDLFAKGGNVRLRTGKMTAAERAAQRAEDKLERSRGQLKLF